jgi:hypothetical protein
MDFTKLHREVIRGEAGGKVIWQPRIGCWVTDRRFRGEPLPDPYEGMSLPDIYRHLGCSNRIYDFNACYRGHEDERVEIRREDISDTDFRVVIDTPVGGQVAIYRHSPNNPWARPIKWPVSGPDEMKVALWREEHRTWSWDQVTYEKLCADWEGVGAPTAFLPRVTVQKLYLDEMGVEGGVMALYDYPDVCKAYFEALNACHERLIEVVNASPIEIINFGDNIHSGTLSVPFFKEYVLPAYQRRCELLHAAGKFVHSHWDGDCRPLLPYAKETGLDGIEAITPQPQGDVTLEETKEALGDMFLIDGIPAIYFDETYSPEVMLECARRCIDLFAPNLILGISDEISSTGDIERIRMVGELVDEYNASL